MFSPKVPRMRPLIDLEIVGSSAGLQLVGEFLVLLKEFLVASPHVEVDSRQLSFQLGDIGHGAVRLRETPIPTVNPRHVLLVELGVPREASYNSGQSGLMQRANRRSPLRQ